jgi:hypothetical protein
MPVIGQLETSGVPKHVRMDREWQLCGFPGPGDRFEETCGRSRTTSLGDKNVSRFHVFSA